MIDSSAVEQLLQTAHVAAIQAGQVIKERNDHPRKVRLKGPRDLVTDTDTAAQMAAVRVILERYPDHRIIAEEDPHQHPTAEGGWTIPEGVVWVIDPLDGTSNFVNHVPVVCASVGVIVDGQPAAGAIFDPLRGEMFEAALGAGVTLNGRPLEAPGRAALEDSIIGLDWAREPAVRERILASVIAFAPHCRTVRALGSAALALAYVAAGRLQAYFNLNLQPWDTGAGAVMIREAGGDLRRPDGSDWKPGDAALVAGHPELVDELVRLMSPRLKGGAKAPRRSRSRG